MRAHFAKLNRCSVYDKRCFNIAWRESPQSFSKRARALHRALDHASACDVLVCALVLDSRVRPDCDRNGRVTDREPGATIRHEPADEAARRRLLEHDRRGAEGGVLVIDSTLRRNFMQTPDLVTSKLPALLNYQLSLRLRIHHEEF